MFKDAVNPIFDRAVNFKTKTYNGFVNKFTHNIGLWAWILGEVKGKNVTLVTLLVSKSITKYFLCVMW